MAVALLLPKMHVPAAADDAASTASRRRRRRIRRSRRGTSCHRSSIMPIFIHPSILCYLGSLFLLPQQVSAFSASPTPPAERPICYPVASDIPSPPIEDDPFEPSMVDNALVAAFRWILQRQSGQISDSPGFDGMMRELIDYRVEHGPEELERVSYRTMVALALIALIRTASASTSPPDAAI